MEMKEIKDFTIEVELAFDVMIKMKAYSEACTTRTFIKKQTIANAILAYSEATTIFWKKVIKTWPKYKGWEAYWTMNGSVVFTKEED